MDGNGVTQKDLRALFDGKRGAVRQADIYTHLFVLTMEPLDFQFPYTPYPIQNEFMAALYETLSAGKIGIFESPTGTVRSRSTPRSINLEDSQRNAGQIA